MGLLNRNDRVMAMQNQAEINPIVIAINSITQNSGIPDWTGGVLHLHVTENNIKWVLNKFGRKCPSNYDYPWFKKAGSFGIGGSGVSYDQPKWDQAWEWYDAYKSGAIPFLEYRIQIREKELEAEENSLKVNKLYVENWDAWKNSENKTKENKPNIKPNRDMKINIRYCAVLIPSHKKEIDELKAELEPLKKQEEQKNRLLDLQEQATHYGVPTRIIKDTIASKKFYKDDVDLIVEEITKQIDLEKSNNQVKNSDLSLENENLRLKKEILEMELKLKGLKPEISCNQDKKVFSEATKSNLDLKDELIEKELYKDQSEYEKWKNIWEIKNK